MDPKPKPDDRLADLAARISRLEQATTPETVVRQSPPKPASPEISPRERRGRKWLRGLILAWCFLIYALLLVQSWDQMPLWMMIFGFFFTIAVALGIYGMNLFYWELGKSVARLLQGKKRS